VQNLVCVIACVNFALSTEQSNAYSNSWVIKGNRGVVNQNMEVLRSQSLILEKAVEFRGCTRKPAVCEECLSRICSEHGAEAHIGVVSLYG
jgi:hypothetical protein